VKVSTSRLTFALTLIALMFAGAAVVAQMPAATKEKDLVAAGHKKLTGSQILPRVLGNTSYVNQLASVPGAPAGINYAIYYRNERERVFRPAEGGGPRFVANWWIEGDFICGEEKGPGPAGHRCYALYDLAPFTYICRQPDGACNSVSRVVRGNPENL